MAQTLSQRNIALNFHYHRHYNSKDCENKDLPGMHRNGNCHFKKQLAKQEKLGQNIQAGNLKDKTEKQFGNDCSESHQFRAAKSLLMFSQFSTASIRNYSYTIDYLSSG